ncbi:MAG: diacylglycerol kinase [Alphaproteobacteria bacterium GM7ARS4]|nr:diacylglycerol kinase [Alphaproteobacteria bacterium GM7ARS4]
MTDSTQQQRHPPKNKGLMDATYVSLRGLLCLLQKESSARKELALIFVSVLSFLAPAPTMTLSYALLGVSVLMLVTECFNSAIERLCDLVHPTYHKDIRDIKDMAAAGILILTLCFMALLMAFIADIVLRG